MQVQFQNIEAYTSTHPFRELPTQAYSDQLQTGFCSMPPVSSLQSGWLGKRGPE